MERPTNMPLQIEMAAYILVISRLLKQNINIKERVFRIITDRH